jgi:hypothetical protein
VFTKSHPKKVRYQKPELIRISLLDESAVGDTGFAPEEPPFPTPPRGGSAPQDSSAFINEPKL